jgi:hypothetical protein
MAVDYVEDYEEVTGLKREKFTAEAKVVTAPEEPKPSRSTKAETKAK